MRLHSLISLICLYCVLCIQAGTTLQAQDNPPQKERHAVSVLFGGCKTDTEYGAGYGLGLGFNSVVILHPTVAPTLSLDACYIWEEGPNAMVMAATACMRFDLFEDRQGSSLLFGIGGGMAIATSFGKGLEPALRASLELQPGSNGRSTGAAFEVGALCIISDHESLSGAAAFFRVGFAD